MANLQLIPGLSAGADISANQFEAVRQGAADLEVRAITVNTQIPIGILQNNPNAAGQGAEVAGPGSTCKARLGGTVTRGDLLTVDGDGELVTATAGTDTTRYVIAQALQSGVDQDVVMVLVGFPARAA